MEIKRENTSYVNKVSEILVKDKRTGKVEDLLIKKGEDILWKRKQKEEQMRENMFAPKITQMAKNLERSGDVFSR